MVALFPPSCPALGGPFPGPLSEAIQNPSHKGLRVVDDATCASGSVVSISFEHYSGLTQYDVSTTDGYLVAAGLPHTMAAPALDYSTDNDKDISASSRDK